MEIGNNKVALIDYTLKNNDGEVIDQSSGGEFAYLHGAQNIIPGLETALAGKKAGDEVSVTIEPADAYGERQLEAIQRVPRNAFPEDIEIKNGMQFQAQGPEGQHVMVTVTNVEADHVTVDGNHPLAGTTLNFDVKVIEVRDATEEELEHGHVHGPGGHHH